MGAHARIRGRRIRRARTHMRTHARERMQTRVRACVRTHAQVCTRTRTQTWARTRPRARACPPRARARMLARMPWCKQAQRAHGRCEYLTPPRYYFKRHVANALHVQCVPARHAPGARNCPRRHTPTRSSNTLAICNNRAYAEPSRALCQHPLARGTTRATDCKNLRAQWQSKVQRLRTASR